MKVKQLTRSEIFSQTADNLTVANERYNREISEALEAFSTIIDRSVGGDHHSVLVKPRLDAGGFPEYLGTEMESYSPFVRVDQSTYEKIKTFFDDFSGSNGGCTFTNDDGTVYSITSGASSISVLVDGVTYYVDYYADGYGDTDTLKHIYRAVLFHSADTYFVGNVIAPFRELGAEGKALFGIDDLVEVPTLLEDEWKIIARKVYASLTDTLYSDVPQDDSIFAYALLDKFNVIYRGGTPPYMYGFRVLLTECMKQYYAVEIPDTKTLITHLSSFLFINEKCLPLAGLLQIVLKAEASNELLANISRIIIQGGSVTELIAQASNAIPSFMERTKEWGNILDNLKSAAAGGVTGLANFVHSIFEKSSQVEEQDGVIDFTDSELYAPKSILAGVLSGVFQTVGLVAVAVGGTIVKLAGMLLSIAGNVVNKIIEVINTNVDEITNIAIDNDAFFSHFPTPVAQGVFLRENLGDLFNNEVVRLVNTYGAVIVQTASSDLFMWVDRNSSTAIAYELYIRPIPRSAFDWAKGHYTISDANTKLAHEYLINSDKHYYLPSGAAENFGEFDRYVETKIEALVEEGSSDILTNIEDLSSRDDEARRQYILGYILTMIKYCAPYNNYSPIKPFDSSGNITTQFSSQAHLAQAFDYLMTLFVDPDRNGELSTSIPEWNELCGFVTGHNYVFYELPKWAKTIRITDNATGTVYLLWDNFAGRFAVCSDTFSGLDSNYVPLSSRPNCMYIVPKYSRKAFWYEVIMSVVAVALIAATAVLTALTVKKKIVKWNAMWSGKAEAAWTAFTEDPTSANYDAYRKAAKKNNVFTRFTGGTRMSYLSYWESGSTAESDVSLVSKFAATDPNEDMSKIDYLTNKIVGTPPEHE